MDFRKSKKQLIQLTMQKNAFEDGVNRFEQQNNEKTPKMHSIAKAYVIQTQVNYKYPIIFLNQYIQILIVILPIETLK